MSHVYTQPMIGEGTQLALAASAFPALLTSPTPTGTPPTTTAVAWIISVKTGFGVGVKEWANLTQAAKRRMATIFDGDTLSGSLQYLPGDATTETLWALFMAKTTVYCVITLPDTSTIECNCFVSKLAPAVEGSEEETDADFELSVDGFVHVTPVAT